MKVKIEGKIYEVKDVFLAGILPMIILDDDTEWYIAENHKKAGEAARKYYEDLAQDDPTEFTCLVGEKALIAWGLGQNYAPGSIGVNSLEEWFDLWLDVPEEFFASYDGVECHLEVTSRDLAEEVGFKANEDAVCYRHN